MAETVTHACDQCGKTPAPIRVDSAIGLFLWNREHPDDRRSDLWFCSEECTFQCGYDAGRRLKQGFVGVCEEVRQKDRDSRRRERENRGKED